MICKFTKSLAFANIFYIYAVLVLPLSNRRFTIDAYADVQNVTRQVLMVANEYSGKELADNLDLLQSQIAHLSHMLHRPSGDDIIKRLAFSFIDENGVSSQVLY